MRGVIILSFLFLFFTVYTQEITVKDSLLVIRKNPEKGFQYDYILFIPEGTPVNKMTCLLVEPNNTGRPSDSIEVHKRAAIDLAAVSSVGNNISTMLKIPLLVPIFPRPASQALVYTHALDRDVMVRATGELERLDLQLIAMIEDARNRLAIMQIETEEKVLMNGFSASATFTNRFSYIHPERVKALAMGGFNGELMLPQETINSAKLNYPLGVNDFYKLFGKKFDRKVYTTIPQFIYMGKLDKNDAVQFEDAYSNKERKIINTNLGREVQERYVKCQSIYRENEVQVIFSTFEGVGHWTTSEVNFEVIKFFFNQIQSKSSGENE